MDPTSSRGRSGETCGWATSTSGPNLGCNTEGEVQEMNLTSTAPSDNDRNLEGGNDDSVSSSSTKAHATVSTLPSWGGVDLPPEAIADSTTPSPRTPSEPVPGPSSQNLDVEPSSSFMLLRTRRVTTSTGTQRQVSTSPTRRLPKGIGKGGKRGRLYATTNIGCNAHGEVQDMGLATTAPSNNGRNLEGGNGNSANSSSTDAQANDYTRPSGSGLIPSVSISTLESIPIVGEPEPGPSSISLRIDRISASDFPQRVYSCCHSWFNEEGLSVYGIRAACQRVVDKIFNDNNHGSYNVFMVDVDLWPEDRNYGFTWTMNDNYRWEVGLTYRTPLILGSRGWVLYVFEQSRFRPITFTLCYNRSAKYNEQQLEPEVFGKSSGEHGFGDEMIALPGGFRYPKSYIFQPKEHVPYLPPIGTLPPMWNV